ncbi:hypothetical protein Trydic_g14449 [Trypoxylus dichotomus]
MFHASVISRSSSRLVFGFLHLDAGTTEFVEITCATMTCILPRDGAIFKIIPEKNCDRIEWNALYFLRRVDIPCRSALHYELCSAETGLELYYILRSSVSTFPTCTILFPYLSKGVECSGY